MKTNYLSLANLLHFNHLVLSLFLFYFLAQPVFASDTKTYYLHLLKEMFQKVTLEKNARAIPRYYDSNFKLQSNGKMLNYLEFLRLHQEIYKTPIQYKIRYEEGSLVEQKNKVAARVFITTQKPHESAREIEVILIAEYKGNKIYRLNELTYPDWSTMKSFRK